MYNVMLSGVHATTVAEEKQ